MGTVTTASLPEPGRPVLGTRTSPATIEEMQAGADRASAAMAEHEASRRRATGFVQCGDCRKWYPPRMEHCQNSRKTIVMDGQTMSGCHLTFQDFAALTKHLKDDQCISDLEANGFEVKRVPWYSSGGALLMDCTVYAISAEKPKARSRKS
jgi:hypothetical protein